MIVRAFFSAVAIGIYTVIIGVFGPTSVLITADTAGQQFDNSNSAYLRAVWVQSLMSHLTAWLALLLFVVLLCFWWTPLKSLYKWIAASVAVVAALVLSMPQSANAFFDKTERTEIIPIPPNWSAFWIPGFGDTKGNQAQKNDEAFLNEKKVSSKYFQIPHSKLAGSAGQSMFAGYDFYVNSGVLLLVDRTRFSHEWVDAHDRGTSATKQGFPCQSKEGLNVTAGVSIASFVTEENAAKFLYNFGVESGPQYKPTGDINSDGQNVFQSVQYGRSLVKVMEDVGRKRIQTFICDEIGQRTLDQDNADYVKIIHSVETNAKTYFASVGIDLDFAGWASTFEFDKDVQDAVNRRYIAAQDEYISKTLQPYSDVIKALAVAQAVRAFGDKSDGKFPGTYVGLTPEIMSVLQQITQPKPSSVK